jgi:malonate transporter and related proteins
VLGVLEGFAIIGAVILAGYLVGRTGVLTPGAALVWSRTVFFVASPCLLFSVISVAPPSELISPLVVIAAGAALFAAGLDVLISRVFLRRPLGTVVISALSAGYSNANNIGLPVATYVLGSATLVAPLIVLQLVFFVPPAMILLEHAGAKDGHSIGRTLVGALRNPLLIASLLGTIVAFSGLDLPKAVLAPFQIVGGAAVPLMLLGFGLSLAGTRILAPGTGRRDVAAATVLKLLVMPATAWLLGALVFHLDARDLHIAVVLAALPTAQNIANYAMRFNFATTIARDAVLVTTIGALPVLLLVSALVP